MNPNQTTAKSQTVNSKEILAKTPYVNYLPKPSPAIRELVRQASGKLQHGLTNDYLFRALLQENNKVLKSLICSILRLPPDNVKSADITNPILLGKEILKKTFFLDINVLLNDNSLINLEMQVANLGNWPERSLGYLCRNFDSLNRGEDYACTKSALHISFLDYSLFPGYPEFFSVYKIINEKNHTVYTDKFAIYVVDLTCINLATTEDRFYEIDKWASLFKAKTWEEIKMLAEQKPLFESAAETIYQLDNDPATRWLCDAHNATLALLRNYEATKEENVRLNQALADKNAEIADKNAEIVGKDAKIADKDAKIADKDAEIKRLKALLAAQSNSEK